MPDRYSGPKHPGDFTGKLGNRMHREAADQKAREAAEEAARATGTEVQLDLNNCHPETGRHGGSDDPDATERVRVSYPIDSMTFGKEVVDPGEFDGNGVCTRPPVLGNLKVYSFEEGRQYRMTPDMVRHLRAQGYLFDF